MVRQEVIYLFVFKCPYTNRIIYENQVDILKESKRTFIEWWKLSDEDKLNIVSTIYEEWTFSFGNGG